MYYYLVNSLLSFPALCLHTVLFPTMSKVAKFKNDLLKANKDTCTAPQSQKILQRVKFVSLTTQAFVKFHEVVEQCNRSLVN